MLFKVHRPSRDRDGLQIDHLPLDKRQSSLPIPKRKTLVSRLKSIRSKWPKGCQGGVTNYLILSIFTLILNIAMACWLSAKGASGQLVVLQRRFCESSRIVMTVIHLVVNVLAALLLAASNSCMQILNSPLREEVDIAHAAKQWMYIGVPNFNNLRHIHWTRRFALPDISCQLPASPSHLEFGGCTGDTCE